MKMIIIMKKADIIFLIKGENGIDEDGCNGNDPLNLNTDELDNDVNFNSDEWHSLFRDKESNQPNAGSCSAKSIPL